MTVKCKDSTCPRRFSCLRFTAKPVKHQKYFKKSPLWNNECNEYFSDPNMATLEEQRELLNDMKHEFVQDNKL